MLGIVLSPAADHLDVLVLDDRDPRPGPAKPAAVRPGRLVRRARGGHRRSSSRGRHDPDDGRPGGELADRVRRARDVDERGEPGGVLDGHSEGRRSGDHGCERSLGRLAVGGPPRAPDLEVERVIGRVGQVGDEVHIRIAGLHPGNDRFARAAPDQDGDRQPVGRRGGVEQAGQRRIDLTLVDTAGATACLECRPVDHLPGVEVRPGDHGLRPSDADDLAAGPPARITRDQAKLEDEQVDLVDREAERGRPEADHPSARLHLVDRPGRRRRGWLDGGRRCRSRRARLGCLRDRPHAADGASDQGKRQERDEPNDAAASRAGHASHHDNHLRHRFRFVVRRRAPRRAGGRSLSMRGGGGQ